MLTPLTAKLVGLFFGLVIGAYLLVPSLYVLRLFAQLLLFLFRKEPFELRRVSRPAVQAVVAFLVFFVLMVVYVFALVQLGLEPGSEAAAPLDAELWFSRGLAAGFLGAGVLFVAALVRGRSRAPASRQQGPRGKEGT